MPGVCNERLKEGRLGADDALAGFADGKPRSTIDLRHFDHAAGARRPLDLTQIADEFLWIAVSFHRPSGDEFAGGLAYDTQFEKRPLDGKSCLLFELADGSS